MPGVRVDPSTAPSDLLTTKFYTPRPRANLIARSRLTEHVQAGLGRKVSLISAPAGFGKTTLASSWLASLAARDFEPEAGPDIRAPDPQPVVPQLAWVSLDVGDNDPVQFWSYVIAALDRARPGSGRSALAALRSSSVPPIETILIRLLNELSALTAKIVLVLDDYHVIESPGIHRALAFLIDHLPPQLHLLIITRSDPPLPLARLRARGELAELRAADLRFTPEEAAAFLHGEIGASLSTADVAVLERRTEGWIAGLQLAALAVRNHADRAGFIAAFSGSNRFVVDYLANEVLDQLPPELLSFVVKTSILSRMCGALCDAVIRGEDGVPPAPSSGGQALLEALERGNLFIVPLDDVRGWYRYHHLFAEVARARLGATAGRAEVAELHRRASVWFEQQSGDGRSAIVDAVHHAMAAQDWDRAARLIEQHGLPLALRGNVATVLDWLNTLPDALIRTRPVLGMNHAVMLMFTNQIEASLARLADVERSLPTDATDERTRMTRGQLVLMYANIARYYGDMSRCVDLSRQALEVLPPAATIPVAGALLNLARGYHATGDVSQAEEERAARAVEQQRAAGNLVALLNSITNLARLRVLQGRLRAALATYREAERALPDGLQGMGVPAYYFGTADVLREWNELDAAEQELRQGMALLDGGMVVDADVVALGFLTLARLHQARGRWEAGLRALDDLTQLAHRRRLVPTVAAAAAALRARLHLAQGNLAAATRWAEAAAQPNTEGAYEHELEHLTLARVFIAQQTADAHSSLPYDVVALLDRLLQQAEAAGRIRSAVEMCALRALALQARGERQTAREALRRALGLAAPEGYVRTFVDEGQPMAALLAHSAQRAAQNDSIQAYAGHLLLAFPAEQGGETARTSDSSPALRSALKRSTALVEPLTAREREVLLLIASGASNRDIAEQLVISVGTVKRHINNLFGKLGAQSRVQAVNAARDLDLL